MEFDKKHIKDLMRILHTPSSYLRDQISDLKNVYNFNIIKYPPNFFTDDNMACFLFDLKHFPLDRVIDRFEKEGGRIVLYAEK